MRWERLAFWRPAPPYEDEEKTRLARLVRITGLTVIVGAFLPALHNLWGGRWGSGGTLLAMVTGVVVALGLNLGGRLQAAIVTIIVVLQLSAMGLVLSGRGFHDVGLMIFPAMLVVGGLLLERRSFAGLTTTMVAFVVLAGVAEIGGLLVNPLSPFTLPRNLVDITIILVVTAVAVSLLAESLRESLARARQGEVTLASANAELREQADRIRASEERFRSVIELAVDAILLGDAQGRLVTGNRRAWELTGYEPQQLLGQPIEVLFPPGELRRVPLRYDLLARGETVTMERLVRRGDGTTVPVEMSSKRMPDGTYQTFMRDVSERRRAEEERQHLEFELRHAQKMEAVGRLAGGIAHDFNNMLMVVASSVAVALRDVEPASRVHRCLREVDRATERAGELTRRLLAFSRKQALERRVLDLGALVENLRPMMARIGGERVEIGISVSGGLGPVEVDPGQMEQVVLNLVINACDAMPRRGRLTVEVGNVDLDEDGARALGARSAGPHVVLTVTDTGDGMTEEVRQRIFEPFFTTKPAGQGTGLGLAMVYGAVKQNGGAIRVDSRPGEGTTFRIYLPRAEGAGVSPTAGAAAPPASS
jgi:PAS domain S-box-containing protein